MRLKIWGTRCAAMVMLAALLSGCIIEQSKPSYTAKASDEKALDDVNQLIRRYIAQKDWEAARYHLKQSLELDSRNPETYEAMALVMQNTGEFELAEENFEKALQLKPKFSRARNNYAAFLFDQGRLKESVKQLERVTEDVLYENREAAFFNLGRAYVQMGEYQKAQYAYKRAWDMNKRNSAFNYELAEIHFRLGEFKKSLAYYRAFGQLTKTQTARTLWLGYRLALKTGDENAAASYGLALKGRFPDSKEAKVYRKFESRRNP